jgi:hypothetical protein
LDRKTNLILGSVFILTSGIIFTVERMNAYIYWSAQRLGAVNGGSYPTEARMPSLSDNLFVVLFFWIGIAFGIAFFSGTLKNKLKVMENKS